MHIFLCVVGAVIFLSFRYIPDVADPLWFKFKGIYCEVDFLCEPLGYGSYSINWLGWVVLAAIILFLSILIDP